MRLLICDDDPLAIERTKAYITEFFTRNHLKCPEISLFTDGESLLADSGEKDILFLDIEMPGLNGVFVGNELKKSNKNIIIFVVTSYPEYLDDAMRFHVFRYLSKPLDKERLFRNLQDAFMQYSTVSEKIAIETKEGVNAVNISDIIFVEISGRKTIVHTPAKDYLSIYPMQYWEQKLPHGCFFQSHRSFRINLRYVTDFDHDTIRLFHNNFQAYLTRRKYSQFKEAYLLYLESTR